MILKVKNIRFVYDSDCVLDGITFEARKGEILGIIGPNGSGKTTLIRCLNNTLKPKTGTVLLDDKNICSFRQKDIAKLMGVVPQNSIHRFAFTVLETVLMGRFPHVGRFNRESATDFDIVRNCLQLCGIEHLSSKLVTELSGGEYQKVIIARALAQEPRVLLLDEPTLHLDIHHQLDFLELLKTLTERKGFIVIMVSHDLNLAARYSDTLLVLKEGKIHRAGSPPDVLDSACIKEVYKIDAEIITSKITGMLTIIPVSRTGN
ncbi:MAG: ABC transporter ATP-binding protein [Candidatus Kuenenia sp.]|nr:ABC transporter ATP-binding protein [Candidatus Kuenenia hertensis]